MNKPQILKNVINKIAAAYGNNPGKMLVHTGVIGWALSSLAQVFAIVLNDKIPKEQKLFLIPQEIADAGVNILSFYLITQSVKTLALKLVNTGKWLPASVRKFMTDGAVKDIGKGTFDVLKHGKLTEEMALNFKEFRNGIDVIATTAGSIMSCNIVTPLIRNEIAADRQKTYIAKMNAKSPQANIYMDNVNKPEFYINPSVSNFQACAYNKNLNSRGSMTI